MTIPLATLVIQETKAAIYDYAIGVARAVGLPVSSWQAGDPTRSLYHLHSELLSRLEVIVAGFVQSGFLDYATGDWLKNLADQVFGVTVPEATAATTTVVLTNSSSYVYNGIGAGDITFKNSTTDQTFRNTTGGDLAANGGTLSVTVVADEAGSIGSASAGEIDELVTTLLGVTCTNALAAVGIDEQDEATTRQQCRDRLGSLSPNGPRDAYSYVARNSELTETNVVTRVRVYGDSTTGGVTIYLASPSGGVEEVDRALVETAILRWATPSCITPTVVSASNVTVAIAYELWVYRSVNKTAAEIAEEVETALETLFAERPIGGDIIEPDISGKLYTSLLESTIREVFPQSFRVAVNTPTADTDITNGQVAALGTVTATIHLVTDPA